MTGPGPETRGPDCGNDSAPYVLGALEPAEARAFAHHLGSCAVCRDEVAALARVLDVLPESAPRYEVSPALRRRVMHAVRSEPPNVSVVGARRPGRPWPTPRAKFALPRLGVAAALAFGVLLAIVLTARPAGPTTRVLSASVGHAQVQIAGGHGELIVDHLPPAPPGRVYELWLQRGTRAPAPSTLFAVTSRGTAVLGVPGSLTGITRVLVTVEPSGGSRAPTTPAVIVARV